MYKGHAIAVVVAIGKNRELGKDNKLLWKIPDDLKRFRSLTRGHPIIFGRKTFESILAYRGAPLPERTNIVVTREKNYSVPEGVIVAPSLEEAFEAAIDNEGSDEIHIGGGAQLYKEALPFLDRLYLTLIDAEDASADSFFPAYESLFTKKVSEEAHEWEGLNYRFVNVER
jgi:dihydrofolate reductase